MTRLLIPVLILTVLVGCALAGCGKDKIVPAEEVAAMVGKWRAVEQKYTIADSTVTVAVPRENSWIYVFRPDGVLVNENGYIPCCLPPQYFLNGKQFDPKPVTKVELDPMCASSLCAYCPEMRITQSAADTLMIETCNGTVKTFVRER